MSNLKEQFIADLSRLAELELEFQRLKQGYAEYDEIVMRLQSQGFTDQEHAGQVFVLIDNFAEKNTQFRMAFVKRYEIKMRPAK